MKKCKLLVSVVCLMSAMYLVGCGEGKELVDEDIESIQNEIQAAELKSEQNEPVDIQITKEGQAYELNEKCNVLDAYKEYNIQVDVNWAYEMILHDNFETVEFRTHAVEPADAASGVDGKYDVIDKVNVKVSFTDEMGLIPQAVTKDVLFAREAGTENWEIVGEKCKSWEAKHKSLGGTAWKISTENGDMYLRLRDTIEFFTTQPNNNVDNASEVEFATTILGAVYMNVNGENQLRRIHVLAGTLNDSGEIVLKLEFVNENEEMELKLNDWEKIEKDELPFTEEEYKETADQRG